MSTTCKLTLVRQQIRNLSGGAARFSIGSSDPCVDGNDKLNKAEFGVNVADGSLQLGINTGIRDIPLLEGNAGNDGKVVKWEDSLKRFVFGTDAGENNTASNVGASGVGFFDDKVGVDLQFRKAKSTNNILGIALNAGDKNVEFTIDSSNITTLGTITDGAWEGDKIEIAQGGTGQTTEQAAINALTDVGTASDGQILTVVGGDAAFADAAAVDTLYTANGTIANADPRTVTLNDTLTFTGNTTNFIGGGGDVVIVKNASDEILKLTNTGRAIFTGRGSATNPMALFQENKAGTVNLRVSNTDTTPSTVAHATLELAISGKTADKLERKSATSSVNSANMLFLSAENTTDGIALQSRASSDARIQIFFGTGVNDAAIHGDWRTEGLKVGSKGIADAKLHVDGNVKIVDTTQGLNKVLTSDVNGLANWQIVDHVNLDSIGTNTHADIDTHIADTSIHFTQASISAVNVVTSGTWSATEIAITKGGTGATNQTDAFDGLSPTTAKGDIIVMNGTGDIKLPAGTDGLFLQADSGEASGLKYASAVTPLTIGDSITSGAANGILFEDSSNQLAQSVSLTYDASTFKLIGSGNTDATSVFTAENSDNNLYFRLRDDQRIVYVDGNQTLGHVLTSDANGVGTWQAPTTGGDGIYGGSGSLTGSTIVTMGANTLTFNGNTTIVKGLNEANTDFSFKAQDSVGVDIFQVRNDNRIVYIDGNEADGRVLKSDANGVATWENLVPFVDPLNNVLFTGNFTGPRDILWSKTGTATNTATQVGSQIASFEMSLFDGVVEDIQTWDIQAIASTTVDQASRLSFEVNNIEKFSIYSSSVGIGTGATFPDADSIFTVASTTKASIPAPKMSTTNRDNIPTPISGFQVYNTNTNTLDFYNGTSWLTGGVDGDGIYDGNGNLSGATVVTMGGNTLTFAGNTTIVKGIGTGATFSFKAQDSGGVNIFQVRDDNRIIYEDGNQTLGHVLTSDANGVATWQAPSGGGGSPAGADTQIQFNNTGAFGASSNLTWNDTTLAVSNPGVAIGTTTFEVSNSTNSSVHKIKGDGSIDIFARKLVFAADSILKWSVNGVLENGQANEPNTIGVASSTQSLFGTNMNVGFGRKGVGIGTGHIIGSPGNEVRSGLISGENITANFGVAIAAIGNNIEIQGSNAVALGDDIFQRGSSGIAIGVGLRVNNHVNTVMIGRNLEIQQPDNVLFGTGGISTTILTSSYEQGIYFGAGSDDPHFGVVFPVSGSADGRSSSIGLGSNALLGMGTAGMGEGVFVIGNAGVDPTVSVTNSIQLYTSSGELFVRDASGNVTGLSPHDKDGYWVYDSNNNTTGKRVVIHMEKMMKKLNDKFGWDFFQELMVEIHEEDTD